MPSATFQFVNAISTYGVHGAVTLTPVQYPTLSGSLIFCGDPTYRNANFSGSVTFNNITLPNYYKVDYKLIKDTTTYYCYLNSSSVDLNGGNYSISASINNGDPTDVVFNMRDMVSNAWGIKKVTLSPIFYPNVNDSKICVRDDVTLTTDINGSVTFPTVVPGTYLVTANGARKSNLFFIKVPAYSGSVNAADITVLPTAQQLQVLNIPQLQNTIGLTRAEADLLYERLLQSGSYHNIRVAAATDAQTAESTSGTASYAIQALSASYSPNSDNTISASYSVTASFALNVPVTSSYALNALSSSYAGNVPETASYALNSLSASYASNVPSTASFSLYAISSSHALTVDGDFVPYTGANKDVNLGNNAITASNTIAVGPDAPLSPHDGKMWWDTDDNSLTTSTSSYALFALSASYAPGNPSISASYALSASYAPNAPSVSASYSISASHASIADLATSATNATNATSAISSTSASYALSASYAPSILSISSSYALSASHSDNSDLATSATNATNATSAISATSASYALSASYAPTTPSISSSYALSASHSDNSDLAISATTSTSASYALSASYAPGSSAITASYALEALSASYAPTAPSISSSYALTASFALNGGGNNSTNAVSASWVSASVRITNSDSSSYIPGSNVNGTVASSNQSAFATQSLNSTQSISSSFASFALTSSLANTASFVLSASYAPGNPSISASYALSASCAITSSNAITSSVSLTASYALNSAPITASYANTSSVSLTASFALTTGPSVAPGVTGSITKQTILTNFTTAQESTITGLNLYGNNWDIGIIEEWDETNGDYAYNSSSLVLHFSGSNNATSMVDTSTNAFAVTVNPNAKITSSLYMFNSRSLYLDGSGSLLAFPNTSSFNITGSTPCTIEAWFRTPDVVREGCIFSRGGGAVSWNSTNGIAYLLETYQSRLVWQFNIAGNTYAAISSSVLSNNTWYHGAASYDGTTHRIFINGTLQSQTSTASPLLPNALTTTYLGRVPGLTGADFYGYVDEFRFTNRVARYTASFTTQSAEFPDAVPQLSTKYIGSIGGINDSGVDYGIEKLSDTSLKVRKMSVTGQPVNNGNNILSASVNRVYVNVFDYTKFPVPNASGIISSSYTITATDSIIICKHGAPITITLPVPSASYQRMLNVKNANTGSWAITITGSAIGTLIDNDKSLIINSPWANASLYCDSNQWYIL
jgi:hypothetical protein